MTNILIESAANAHLLIIQDVRTGRRQVITIPFNGVAEGYEAESAAVQTLMSIVVPVPTEVIAEAQ